MNFSDYLYKVHEIICNADSVVCFEVGSDLKFLEPIKEELGDKLRVVSLTEDAVSLLKSKGFNVKTYVSEDMKGSLFLFRNLCYADIILTKNALIKLSKLKGEQQALFYSDIMYGLTPVSKEVIKSICDAYYNVVLRLSTYLFNYFKISFIEVEDIAFGMKMITENLKSTSTL